MPYEDYTTYTETDTGDDRIQTVAQHLDHVSRRDEDTYLTDDKGAAHFTDFVHDHDVRATAMADFCYGYVWMLANALDDGYGLIGNTNEFIAVFWYRTGSSYRIYLTERDTGGAGYSDYYATTSALVNLWRYLVMTKSGTGLTCKIYSDAARTTLVDTLSLTLQADYSFRYIYACNTFNTSETIEATLEMENLDLHEAVGLSIPVAMHHYGHHIGHIIRG